ncbi:MAG: hypothetical protein AB197_00445 [Parcubacteria bacterium C7867-002]|nr:MAG: hypothetical protein AB197_00445 [Parcubacteria bacterium C7867-002]
MTKQKNPATAVLPRVEDFVLEMPEGIAGWVLPEVQQSTREQVKEHDLQEDMMWMECEQGHTLGEYFDILTHTHRIRRCLNVDEGRILINNNALASPFFEGKQIVLWRSVGHDHAGNYLVPIIQNITGQQPLMYWHYCRYPLSRRHATYTFRGHM